MKHPLAAFLMLLAAPPGSAAEPLPRLFFTPEQRAQLERQRLTGEAALGDGESVRLDGIATRFGGRTTVWVNGRTLPDTSPHTVRRGPAPERASLLLADGSRINLNVGETADSAAGTRSDVVAAGAIRVARRPPTAR